MSTDPREAAIKAAERRRRQTAAKADEAHLRQVVDPRDLGTDGDGIIRIGTPLPDASVDEPT